MGRGDRKNHKSIGVDLAPAPRKKARGWKRMQELGRKQFCVHPGNACLYAIGARGTEFLKIGVANDPYRRLKELQTANPYELALLYAVETNEDQAFQIEKAVHQSTEARNAKGMGEWLDISPRIIPMLIAFAADAVGAELVWRFGSPADEEPEDFNPHEDLLMAAASGYSAARAKTRRR